MNTQATAISKVDTLKNLLDALTSETLTNLSLGDIISLRSAFSSASKLTEEVLLSKIKTSSEFSTEKNTIEIVDKYDTHRFRVVLDERKQPTLKYTFVDDNGFCYSWINIANDYGEESTPSVEWIRRNFSYAPEREYVQSIEPSTVEAGIKFFEERKAAMTVALATTY